MIRTCTLARAALGLAVGLLTSVVSAQQIRSTPVMNFSDVPIGVTSAPGDSHRLFVLERAGKIRILRDGNLLLRPFLDIHAEVSTGGEAGLLGLAFHPDYRANGRFFVSFIGSAQNDPVLREYRVSSDPDLADPASGVDLFSHVSNTGQGHYGSDIAFGPDGMLFYSFGDDNRQDLPQRPNSHIGKLLRLDVDRPPTFVPTDNPYPAPSDGGHDWLWALGFRNPYRFTFDRLTGDLYIADVGDQDSEEIDFQRKSTGTPGSPGYMGGKNYGWPCMEGRGCTGASQCTCDTTGATLLHPAHEFLHQGLNAAIIGGFVYRGSAIPGLQGRYFFGDYNQARVWTLEIQNGTATNVQEVTAQLGAGVPGGPYLFTSFGEDANGEIYFTSMIPTTLYRIDPVTPVSSPPVAYCTSAPNSAGSGARIDSAGCPTIANPELVLIAEHAPPNVFGLFFHGDQEAQVPLGNGWRCIGGSLLRCPVVQTDAHGMASQAFDPSSISATPGQVRDFQFFYRDNPAGGARLNLSDGLRVVFCP